jgi:hypothetical protein
MWPLFIDALSLHKFNPFFLSRLNLTIQLFGITSEASEAIEVPICVCVIRFFVKGVTIPFSIPHSLIEYFDAVTVEQLDLGGCKVQGLKVWECCEILFYLPVVVLEKTKTFASTLALSDVAIFWTLAAGGAVLL